MGQAAAVVLLLVLCTCVCTQLTVAEGAGSTDQVSTSWYEALSELLAGAVEKGSKASQVSLTPSTAAAAAAVAGICM